MGIIKAIYNEQAHEDRVWYDSSNIFFSRFVESATDNYGDLYITFTNGTTYVYHGVHMPTDYILFKFGGIDGSQGKTLNKQIKGKYEFEKVSGVDIELLKEELDTVLKEGDNTHTYFISGHGDVTDREFETYYQPALEMALENDPDARFIVGDFKGVDIMAQNYLVDVLDLDPEKITVYHMFESPRNINPRITKTNGGYTDDESRDSAMTAASMYDIAFVRPGKESSCTAKNIIRRYLMV